MRDAQIVTNTAALSCSKCSVCKHTTQHVIVDNITICTRCHPALDPGLTRRSFVTSKDRRLKAKIDLVAIRAGLDPATGKRVTLDQIITRNSTPSPREQVSVFNRKGRTLKVPPGCPVPLHLIANTWCDWADGWYIKLTNGHTLREQPGAFAYNVEYGESYRWLTPGWHVFLGERAKEQDKVLSVPEVEPCAYPSTATLETVWSSYQAYLKIEGACPTCLSLEGHRRKPFKASEGLLVSVPLIASRPQNATVTGTWWRYRGHDRVVQAAQQPDKTREGWVLLRKPTNNEIERVRADLPTQVRPWGETRVWDDDSDATDGVDALDKWVAGGLVLDVYRSVLGRWWNRRSLEAQVGFILTLGVVSNTAVHFALLNGW